MSDDRITNLRWIYPDFPPRPVKREVMFSLIQFKDALYFVNESNETLDIVSSQSFGFVENAALENSPKFHYKNVKIGESVKIEKYDDFYDLDYVLGINIFVQSNELKKIVITPPLKKGGIKSQELLFCDNSISKYVDVRSIE